MTELKCEIQYISEYTKQIIINECIEQAPLLGITPQKLLEIADEACYEDCIDNLLVFETIIKIFMKAEAYGCLFQAIFRLRSPHKKFRESSNTIKLIKDYITTLLNHPDASNKKYTASFSSIYYLHWEYVTHYIEPNHISIIMERKLYRIFEGIWIDNTYIHTKFTKDFLKEVFLSIDCSTRDDIYNILRDPAIKIKLIDSTPPEKWNHQIAHDINRWVWINRDVPFLNLELVKRLVDCRNISALFELKNAMKPDDVITILDYIGDAILLCPKIDISHKYDSPSLYVSLESAYNCIGENIISNSLNNIEKLLPFIERTKRYNINLPENVTHYISAMLFRCSDDDFQILINYAHFNKESLDISVNNITQNHIDRLAKIKEYIDAHPERVDSY
jgi:hypothetical protein